HPGVLTALPGAAAAVLRGTACVTGTVVALGRADRHAAGTVVAVRRAIVPLSGMVPAVAGATLAHCGMAPAAHSTPCWRRPGRTSTWSRHRGGVQRHLSGRVLVDPGRPSGADRHHQRGQGSPGEAADGSSRRHELDARSIICWSSCPSATMGGMRLLLSYLRRYWGLVALALLLAAINQ